MKLILTIIIAIASMSCSSLKKRCEQKNWFDYAKEVALSGKRLSSDSFYNQCLKKEAEIDEMSADQGFKQGMNEYCEVDSPFEYGKKGLSYNFEFCGHINTKKMKSQHTKGLRIYCDSANGQTEGIKGKPYNGLCPQDLKKAFLKEFNIGRVKFLKAEALDQESIITNFETELKRNEREHSRLRRDLREISRYYDTKNQVIIAPGTIIISPRTKSKLRNKEAVENEKRLIERDIYSLKNKISNKEAHIRDAQEELRKLKKEIILISQ